MLPFTRCFTLVPLLSGFENKITYHTTQHLEEDWRPNQVTWKRHHGCFSFSHPPSSPSAPFFSFCAFKSGQRPWWTWLPRKRKRMQGAQSVWLFLIFFWKNLGPKGLLGEVVETSPYQGVLPVLTTLIYWPLLSSSTTCSVAASIIVYLILKTYLWYIDFLFIDISSQAWRFLFVYDWQFQTKCRCPVATIHGFYVGTFNRVTGNGCSYVVCSNRRISKNSRRHLRFTTTAGNSVGFRRDVC